MFIPQFTKKLTLAITTISAESSTSVWLAIVAFKLNCLLARKCFIDRCYEQSRKRYEEAWSTYATLNDRIANYSLMMEFQQFYVNALFQLSNVYYKLNMPNKSFHFCEQTMDMISDILVNRLALTQEAYFQELAFKKETIRDSSPSPIRMEMAMLMNEKKVVKSTRKKLQGSSKEGTPAKSSRRTKTNSKTPAKPAKIKLESPETFSIPTVPVVVVAVDENSSVLGNMAISQPKVEESKRRTTTSTSTARKIPVRSSSTIKSSSKETTVKTVSSTIIVSKRKTSSTLVISQDTIAAVAAPTPVVSTRKTSRRLI